MDANGQSITQLVIPSNEREFGFDIETLAVSISLAGPLYCCIATSEEVPSIGPFCQALIVHGLVKCHIFKSRSDAAFGMQVRGKTHFKFQQDLLLTRNPFLC